MALVGIVVGVAIGFLPLAPMTLQEKITESQKIAVQVFKPQCVPDIQAVVSFPNENQIGEAEYLIYEDGTITDCVVRILRHMKWKKFCSVMVHEYGHLTGLGHSEDPNDVMYAYYKKPYWLCNDRKTKVYNQRRRASTQERESQSPCIEARSCYRKTVVWR